MKPRETRVETPRYKLRRPLTEECAHDVVQNLLKHVRPEGHTEIIVTVVNDGDYTEVYGTITQQIPDGWFRRLLRWLGLD